MAAHKNSIGESNRVLRQIEELIAECDRLKEENEKLRKDINAAVMHSIQNIDRNIRQEKLAG